MRGVKGDMIPIVALFGVRGSVGIAVLLLFPHEGPLLVELHLARLIQATDEFASFLGYPLIEFLMRGDEQRCGASD